MRASTPTYTKAFARRATALHFALALLLYAAAGQQQPREQERPAQTTLRGRVVFDDTGLPVRDAKVKLVEADKDERPQRYGIPPEWSADTDHEGEFELTNVEAGRYFVIVESPGVISPLLLVGYDFSLAHGVASGKVREDFALVSVDGLTDARVEVRARRGGTITGRATRADGRPASGAEVAVFRLREGVLTPLTFYHLRTDGVRTDERGVYRVAGLPTDEYVVKVIDRETQKHDLPFESNSPTGDSLVFAYHPNTASLKEAKRVRVEAGQESEGVDVSFPARQTHTVSGVVFSRRGNVPLDDVRVALDLTEEGYDDSMPPTSAEGWTDDEGRWVIAGVPDGLYTLKAARPYEPLGSEAAKGEEAEVRYFVDYAREFKVAGADAHGVTITLDDAATITGTVVAEGGEEELPGVVRLVVVSAGEEVGVGGQRRPPAADSHRPPRTLLTHDELWQMTTTSGDEFDEVTGRFEIKGAPTGRIYIHALAPVIDGHYYVKSITRKGVDLMREPLRVGAGEHVKGVRILLARGAATLTGRVLKPAGGPASEIEVALIPVEPLRRRAYGATASATTDAEGRFEIEDAPPGEYYVFTEHEKERVYLTISEDEVRAGAASWPRVTLKPRERRKMNVTLREGK